MLAPRAIASKPGLTCGSDAVSGSSRCTCLLQGLLMPGVLGRPALRVASWWSPAATQMADLHSWVFRGLKTDTRDIKLSCRSFLRNWSSRWLTYRCGRRTAKSPSG